jgi:hypothetical protein
LLRSTNCAQLVTLGVTRFCGCSTMKRPDVRPLWHSGQPRR